MESQTKMSAQSEEEEFQFQRQLEQEVAQKSSIQAKDAPAPVDGATIEKNWANPLVRGAVGISTGIGEAMNPLAIPHSLETLGRVGAHGLNTLGRAIVPGAEEAPQESNLNDPWYRRLGQIFQNASDSSVTPAMRIEQIAPGIRAGIRSVGNLARLDAPDFSNNLAYEQQVQKDFNQSLPAHTQAIGEVLPGLVSLGSLGAKAIGLGSTAEAAANDARVAALGGGKKEIKQWMKNDQIQERGNQLKQDEIMGPFTSRAQIEKNLAAAKSGYGKTMSDIVGEADLENRAAIPAQQIADKAINEKWLPAAQYSTTQEEANALQKEIDSLMAMHGKQNLSMQDIENLKQGMGKKINWYGQTSPSNEANKSFYNVLKTSSEDALDNIAKDLPPGSSLEDFKTAKKGFGFNQAAQEMVADRNAREMANRMFSPSAQITGATSAMVTAAHGNNPVLSYLTGVGAAMLHKGIHGYGNQMKASAWQKLANGIGAPNMINPLVENVGSGVGAINYLAPQPSWQQIYNKENQR